MSDRVIGGYALRRVLGRGGMGEVHLATTPTGGLAAVKVIHPGLARDPAFRRRFEREVAAARRVARFCTAPVLDAGLDGDVAYLVTEYVKGPDLARAVREQGPLSGGNLEALAVGIATALSAIHGAGVIHRDLKPSNVLLSPLGPRVIDFGIAQLVGSDTSQVVVGTPAYMAPEQARGEQVGPYTDVFAWGGVIAFAGTGRQPFGGGSPAEALHRVVNDPPHLDGLDAGVRGLVEQALAKDPRSRPPVSLLLAELLGGSRISPASATEVVERTWTTPLTHPPTPGSTESHPAPGIVPGGAPGTERHGVHGGILGAGVPGAPGTERHAAPEEVPGGGVPGVPRSGGRVAAEGVPYEGAGGPPFAERHLAAGAVPGGGVPGAPRAERRPAPGGVPGVPSAERHPAAGGVPGVAGGGPRGGGGGEVSGRSSRKRWRRWVVGGVLGAVVAGGAAAAVAVMGPEVWPYESGFEDGWEVGASDAGTAGRDGSGYVLAVEDGWRLWKSAPRREPDGGVVVSAKARLLAGAGEYGVWCHGASGDRYEFTVTGAGRVAIVKRRAGKEGVVLHRPEKAQVSDTSRVVAECAGGGGAVTLRMWLNERLVAEAEDREAPFGPGMAGVLAAPEAGKAVRVRFESFALRPAGG
ncbi:protein kinase [Nonomuraea sp. NPDC048826]|uniref:serine/threonine-protein kinase n=1 Tax=Nonomuraea sp. NPDC048826 TaxID=3364347 RepID=UPI00371906FA